MYPAYIDHAVGSGSGAVSQGYDIVLVRGEGGGSSIVTIAPIWVKIPLYAGRVGASPALFQSQFLFLPQTGRSKYVW